MGLSVSLLGPSAVAPRAKRAVECRLYPLDLSRAGDLGRFSVARLCSECGCRGPDLLPDASEGCPEF